MERYEEIVSLRLAGLSFAEIARRLGVSRQRVQQIVAPPKALRDRVIARSDGKCADCGLEVGRSGHVHHGAPDSHDGDWYNQEDRLVLVCASCHRHRHVGTNENGQWAGVTASVELSDAKNVDLEAVAAYLKRRARQEGLTLDITIKPPSEPERVPFVD